MATVLGGSGLGLSPAGVSPAGLRPPVGGASGTGGGRPAPVGPRVAAAPRQLQTRWLVAAAAAVVLGGLLVLWAVPRYAQRAAVVVLTRDVKAGSVLAAGDLTTADLSVDGQVEVVRPQDGTVGKTALTDLPRGSVLSPRQVGAVPTLAAGQTVVPVRLKLGQRPQQGLGVGQPVLAVPAAADPGAPAAAALAQVPPFRASVVSAGDPDPATGDAVVDLRVREADAVGLVRAAATGSVTLVLVPGGGS